MDELEINMFVSFTLSGAVSLGLKYNRYGVELARLGEAQRESKSAYDIGRRGGIAPAVLHDAKVGKVIYSSIRNLIHIISRS